MCAFLFTGNWFQSMQFIFERVWQAEEVLKCISQNFGFYFYFKFSSFTDPRVWILRQGHAELQTLLTALCCEHRPSLTSIQENDKSVQEYVYDLRSFHVRYCFTVAHCKQFWYRMCTDKSGIEQCGKLEWVMQLC